MSDPGLSPPLSDLLAELRRLRDDRDAKRAKYKALVASDGYTPEVHALMGACGYAERMYDEAVLRHADALLSALSRLSELQAAAGEGKGDRT